MRFRFRQGFSYVAGIDKPLVLSRGTIVEAVEELGFAVIFAGECEETIERFPFRVPGGCGDEWDWVGYAERTGPTRVLDVPDRVKWIQEIPARRLPPKTAPKQPPQKLPKTWHNAEPTPWGSFAIAASAGSAVGAAVMWYWMRRRR